MRRQKRGVSPLIATVLLISFAVALAAVVLNWGRQLNIASDDPCSDVNIRVLATRGIEACYTTAGQDTFVTMELVNGGKMDIAGVGIWFIGNRGTKFIEFNEFQIKQGDRLALAEQIVSFDQGQYGQLTKMQIIPKVDAEGTVDICTSHSVQVEDIGLC